YLQRHPLARLTRGSGFPGGASVGQALRQVLTEAIDALRPAEPSSGSKAGRSHDLLTLRYVEGHAVTEVCERLGISTREIYREHRNGLEAVASMLWERWGLDSTGPSGTTEAEADGQSEDQAVPPLPRPNRVALPRPLSSFVGRARELARLQALLASSPL